MPGERTGKFRWLIVKGTVDNLRVRAFRLWPVKSGGLFMPIRAEIRRAIGKSAGDTVRVRLTLDDGRPGIPKALIESLKLDARAERAFYALPPEDIRSICSSIGRLAGTAREKLIVSTLDRLAKKNTG
jgi:hypothetical protein